MLKSFHAVLPDLILLLHAMVKDFFEENRKKNIGLPVRILAGSLVLPDLFP